MPPRPPQLASVGGQDDDAEEPASPLMAAAGPLVAVDLSRPIPHDPGCYARDVRVEAHGLANEKFAPRNGTTCVVRGYKELGDGTECMTVLFDEDGQKVTIRPKNARVPIGAVVQVQGLQNNGHLNGEVGEVTRHKEANVGEKAEIPMPRGAGLTSLGVEWVSGSTTVKAVSDGGTAAAGGVIPGMVLKELSGRKVASLFDVQTALREATVSGSGADAALLFQRDLLVTCSYVVFRDPSLKPMLLKPLNLRAPAPWKCPQCAGMIAAEISQCECGGDRRVAFTRSMVEDKEACGRCDLSVAETKLWSSVVADDQERRAALQPAQERFELAKQESGARSGVFRDESSRRGVVQGVVRSARSVLAELSKSRVRAGEEEEKHRRALAVREVTVRLALSEILEGQWSGRKSIGDTERTARKAMSERAQKSKLEAQARERKRCTEAEAGARAGVASAESAGWRDLERVAAERRRILEVHAQQRVVAVKEEGDAREAAKRAEKQKRSAEVDAWKAGRTRIQQREAMVENERKARATVAKTETGGRGDLAGVELKTRRIRLEHAKQRVDAGSKEADKRRTGAADERKARCALTRAEMCWRWLRAGFVVARRERTDREALRRLVLRLREWDGRGRLLMRRLATVELCARRAAARVEAGARRETVARFESAIRAYHRSDESGRRRVLSRDEEEGRRMRLMHAQQRVDAGKEETAARARQCGAEKGARVEWAEDEAHEREWVRRRDAARRETGAAESKQRAGSTAAETSTRASLLRLELCVRHAVAATAAAAAEAASREEVHRACVSGKQQAALADSVAATLVHRRWVAARDSARSWEEGHERRQRSLLLADEHESRVWVRDSERRCRALVARHKRQRIAAADAESEERSEVLQEERVKRGVAAAAERRRRAAVGVALRAQMDFRDTETRGRDAVECSEVVCWADLRCAAEKRQGRIRRDERERWQAACVEAEARYELEEWEATARAAKREEFIRHRDALESLLRADAAQRAGIAVDERQLRDVTLTAERDLRGQIVARRAARDAFEAQEAAARWRREAAEVTAHEALLVSAEAEGMQTAALHIRLQRVRAGQAGARAGMQKLELAEREKVACAQTDRLGALLWWRRRRESAEEGEGASRAEILLRESRASDWLEVALTSSAQRVAARRRLAAKIASDERSGRYSLEQEEDIGRAELAEVEQSWRRNPPPTRRRASVLAASAAPSSGAPASVPLRKRSLRRRPPRVTTPGAPPLVRIESAQKSPRAGTPRAGPRAGTPRAGTPRAGTPRADTPRAATPRVVHVEEPPKHSPPPPPRDGMQSALSVTSLRSARSSSAASTRRRAVRAKVTQPRCLSPSGVGLLASVLFYQGRRSIGTDDVHTCHSRLAHEARHLTPSHASLLSVPTASTLLFPFHESAPPLSQADAGALADPEVARRIKLSVSLGLACLGVDSLPGGGARLTPGCDGKHRRQVLRGSPLLLRVLRRVLATAEGLGHGELAVAAAAALSSDATTDTTPPPPPRVHRRRQATVRRAI